MNVARHPHERSLAFTAEGPNGPTTATLKGFRKGDMLCLAIHVDTPKGPLKAHVCVSEPIAVAAHRLGMQRMQQFSAFLKAQAANVAASGPSGTPDGSYLSALGPQLLAAMEKLKAIRVEPTGQAGDVKLQPRLYGEGPVAARTDTGEVATGWGYARGLVTGSPYAQRGGYGAGYGRYGRYGLGQQLMAQQYQQRPGYQRAFAAPLQNGLGGWAHPHHRYGHYGQGQYGQGQYGQYGQFAQQAQYGQPGGFVPGDATSIVSPPYAPDPNTVIATPATALMGSGRGELHALPQDARIFLVALGAAAGRPSAAAKMQEFASHPTAAAYASAMQGLVVAPGEQRRAALTRWFSDPHVQTPMLDMMTRLAAAVPGSSIASQWLSLAREVATMSIPPHVGGHLALRTSQNLLAPPWNTVYGGQYRPRFGAESAPALSNAALQNMQARIEQQRLQDAADALAAQIQSGGHLALRTSQNLLAPPWNTVYGGQYAGPRFGADAGAHDGAISAHPAVLDLPIHVRALVACLLAECEDPTALDLVKSVLAEGGREHLVAAEQLAVAPPHARHGFAKSMLTSPEMFQVVYDLLCNASARAPKCHAVSAWAHTLHHIAKHLAATGAPPAHPAHDAAMKAPPGSVSPPPGMHLALGPDGQAWFTPAEGSVSTGAARMAPAQAVIVPSRIVQRASGPAVYVAPAVAPGYGYGRGGYDPMRGERRELRHEERELRREQWLQQQQNQQQYNSQGQPLGYQSASPDIQSTDGGGADADLGDTQTLDGGTDTTTETATGWAGEYRRYGVPGYGARAGAPIGEAYRRYLRGAYGHPGYIAPTSAYAVAPFGQPAVVTPFASYTPAPFGQPAAYVAPVASTLPLDAHTFVLALGSSAGLPRATAKLADYAANPTAAPYVTAMQNLVAAAPQNAATSLGQWFSHHETRRTLLHSMEHIAQQAPTSSAATAWLPYARQLAAQYERPAFGADAPALAPPPPAPPGAAISTMSPDLVALPIDMRALLAVILAECNDPRTPELMHSLESQADGHAYLAEASKLAVSSPDTRHAFGRLWAISPATFQTLCTAVCDAAAKAPKCALANAWAHTFHRILRHLHAGAPVPATAAPDAAVVATTPAAPPAHPADVTPPPAPAPIKIAPSPASEALAAALPPPVPGAGIASAPLASTAPTAADHAAATIAPPSVGRFSADAYEQLGSQTPMTGAEAEAINALPAKTLAEAPVAPEANLIAARRLSLKLDESNDMLPEGQIALICMMLDKICLALRALHMAQRDERHLDNLKATLAKGDENAASLKMALQLADQLNKTGSVQLPAIG